MENKLSPADVQLRKLIRRIAREEVARYMENQETADPSPRLAIKKQEEKQAPQKSQEKKTQETQSIQVSQVMDPPPKQEKEITEHSWAIFGSPQPDATQNYSRQQRPRALPGWTEPYRPEFEEFDAPPFLAHKPY